MVKSSAEKQKEYRNRLRGGPPRQPQPCGTPAAAKRHLRNGEPTCEPCRKAQSEYRAQLRANRSPETQTPVPTVIEDGRNQEPMEGSGHANDN